MNEREVKMAIREARANGKPIPLRNFPIVAGRILDGSCDVCGEIPGVLLHEHWNVCQKCHGRIELHGFGRWSDYVIREHAFGRLVNVGQEPPDPLYLVNLQLHEEYRRHLDSLRGSVRRELYLEREAEQAKNRVDKRRLIQAFRDARKDSRVHSARVAVVQDAIRNLEKAWRYPDSVAYLLEVE